MNKVVLVGRIARMEEMRASGDLDIQRFTLAVDRKYKKDGEATADFINCIAFGKSADFINKYFSKGSRIAIEGRIQTGSYEKKDGTKVYTTDIIVEGQEFCESKKESAPEKPKTPAENEGFMQVADGLADEGLPFN